MRHPHDNGGQRTTDEDRCHQHILNTGAQQSCRGGKLRCAHSPISPCLVMGLEWILRMSRRACSLGSSMSGDQKWILDLLCALTQSWHTEDQREQWKSYGFYDPVFQAATRLGPECPVCWWPWSSWLCVVCRSRPSGSAADTTQKNTEI